MVEYIFSVRSPSQYHNNHHNQERLKPQSTHHLLLALHLLFQASTSQEDNMCFGSKPKYGSEALNARPVMTEYDKKEYKKTKYVLHNWLHLFSYLSYRPPQINIMEHMLILLVTSRQALDKRHRRDVRRSKRNHYSGGYGGGGGGGNSGGDGGG